MNQFGIDVQTKDARKLVRTLVRLKTTVSGELGGMYHQDRAYSQIFVDTVWTEEKLDDWLYSTKHGCDYVGIFVLDKNL